MPHSDDRRPAGATDHRFQVLGKDLPTADRLDPGELGGAVAAGILYLAIDRLLPALSQEIAAYVQVRPGFYLLILAGGTVLGLVGSLISVIRFIRPRSV